MCSEPRKGLVSSKSFIAATMMTSSNGNILRVTGPVRGIHRSPVRSFNVFFHLRLNQLNKQSWGWLFNTPSCSLWRHCNDVITSSTTQLITPANLLPGPFTHRAHYEIKQDCFFQKEARVCVSNAFVIEDSRFKWCFCCGRWESDRGSRYANMNIVVEWKGMLAEGTVVWNN